MPGFEAESDLKAVLLNLLAEWVHCTQRSKDTVTYVINMYIYTYILIYIYLYIHTYTYVYVCVCMCYTFICWEAFSLCFRWIAGWGSGKVLGLAHVFLCALSFFLSWQEHARLDHRWRRCFQDPERDCLSPRAHIPWISQELLFKVIEYLNSDLKYPSSAVCSGHFFHVDSKPVSLNPMDLQTERVQRNRTP